MITLLRSNAITCLTLPACQPPIPSDPATMGGAGHPATMGGAGLILITLLTGLAAAALEIQVERLDTEGALQLKLQSNLEGVTQTF